MKSLVTVLVMLVSRREKKSIAWCQCLAKISQDELSFKKTNKQKTLTTTTTKQLQP